jgi:hypothetical protein
MGAPYIYDISRLRVKGSITSQMFPIRNGLKPGDGLS